MVGAAGLAGALTVAAIVAPARAARAAAAYRPADGDAIVARVAVRAPDEIAARQALAQSPDDVELAVELARADLARYRAASDPRYLGRAQATLARWWAQPAPPPDVLLLRAIIAQSLHAFAPARADLDQLIARRPTDAQAHLTRAVVATVTADYAAARASCVAVRGLASPLVATTCEAILDGLAGDAAGASARLQRALDEARPGDRGVRGWALTTLAELAIARGDTSAATRHLEHALALDTDDAYARDLLADVLLETGRPADASRLLAGREAIDSHLVRLAIAAHRGGARDAPRLIATMRERFTAAALRGDRVHLREEARFALAIDRDSTRALALARANWEVQRELADARLLLEAATAAADRTAAAPVLAWMRHTGVRDAWLDRRVATLEETP